MGTRFELVLDGDDETRLRAAGEEALFEIEEADRRLSLFRRDSLLSHIVRTAPREPVRVDLDTFELLTLCAEVHGQTTGAFDPTVAPLMRALGLHGDSQVPHVREAEARDLVAFDAVQLDPGDHSVRITRPNVALDLGGVAKGHALDLAARSLRDSGVTCGLLHGGTSTVLALSPPPGERSWRIRLGAGAASPVAHLTREALSVSAPHGRVAGEHHHVLDPETGLSSEGIAVAAALSESAAKADAWSTALLVRGNQLTPPADVELLHAPERSHADDDLQWCRGSHISDRFQVPTTAVPR